MKQPSPAGDKKKVNKMNVTLEQYEPHGDSGRRMRAKGSRHYYRVCVDGVPVSGPHHRAEAQSRADEYESLAKIGN